MGSKTGLLNQLAFVYGSDGVSTGQEQLPPNQFLYTTSDGMCIRCQGKGAYYDVNLDQIIPDQTTTLLKLYEKLHITAGFLRILRKKYGDYFDTPFCQLPEEVREEVVYGNYDLGKQSYCLERHFRNSYERGEDVELAYSRHICPVCHGERVGSEARKVLLHGKNIGELGQMTIDALCDFLTSIPRKELSQFSHNVVKDMIEKLNALRKFRLGHLSLYREMSTLSGGEIQRLFLHLHLESKLDSLIYVFDEPMAGLHPSEKQSMIDAVKRLRDLGNTVIVVEHDKDMIRYADHIIEIGPKAGVEGGQVVYQGDYKGYMEAGTCLSDYINGQSVMGKRSKRMLQAAQKDCINIEHANVHYLKDVSVCIPLHAMVGVAGVSGSGKSSLIADTLLARLVSAKKYGTVVGLSGYEDISGVVEISQEPIGRNANSTPASYIGVWDKIRELYAMQPEAVNRGMSAGNFSFHSKGACPDCGGSGMKRIYLTASFSVDKTCKACQGSRFNEESRLVIYKDKNIVDVLKMSIADACTFFEDQETIARPLRILNQMGMGYLTLGQPTASLSGGEAQRVKLAKELGKCRKGNMLYVLDEPTTGLSMYDTALLLKLLDGLVEDGNSVIVIEHNVDILKNCDYLIELGPEGGDKGGNVIATGTVEELKKNSHSVTGQYLV